MLKDIKKLRILMDKKQKKQMAALMVMMIIGAFLEMTSITLVIPVVTAVIQPDVLDKYEIVRSVCNLLHINTTLQFTVVSMIALILIFIAKDAFLFWQQKRMYRFVFTNQFQTAERLLRSYVNKDYEYFLNAETSVIQRSITADINNMYTLVLAMLQLVSEVIVFLFVGVTLFVLDPLMTLTLCVLLIVTLLVIKRIIKPIMNRTGKANQDYGASMYEWITQTVTGIKEVKVNAKEQYFIGEYLKQGKGYINAMEVYSMFANTPKLLIEAVCITGMILYMLVLVLTGADVGNMIPTISAFAFAAVRLMPSASRINNQLTQISFCEPFFFNVSDNLLEDISEEKIDLSYAVEAKKKLPVTKEICLSRITYKYPNTEKYIFDHADLTIPVGSAIGIVGGSGAGKTTIVDIILGLLKPEEGKITADGVDVQEHYREWLKNIGYIPQMIALLNADIRKNIAYGVKEEDIDEDKLRHAIEEAQLDSFVDGLPDGDRTGIGERGIRISGGQRQRIGIARALYEDPEVLILDEATSALDNDTEAAIMESINRLHGRKTLIIIAHRLQTIEKCDMVFRVENGKIVKER
ncbi:MAG: ABC transporter ATP-binding protein [Lachnospiraceae bacterium]|nr:ABC transporter ATP-binding protein [Lachnospiraceae bacterium]MDE6063641.1 ABC transporter ATP-binding protein/permease [Lachnospiraceae bacterium]